MLIVFKCLLILAVFLLSYLLLLRPEAHLPQRLLGFLLGAILSVFVAFPSLTTDLAHVFGIGRGADFLFYLAHLTVLYLVAILYRRMQSMRRELTLLIRSVALKNVHEPQ